MRYLSLSVSGQQIILPAGVPTGGAGLTLNKILSISITLLIIAAIVLCIIFIIWGGINWIMSEGDKQKLSQAHRKVTFAIIGLIVVFLAFFIINTFSYFFLGNSSVIRGG